MKDLNRKAMIGFFRMAMILVAVVFLPGLSFNYWQGWGCLLAFFAPAGVISVYVARHDPALLERRLKAGASAEKEIGQKIVQAIAGIVFVADFIIPAFDHRFGWSSVPGYAAIAADFVIVAGFVIVFRVFRANSYASGIVEVSANQTVISTGPYALVRHPMYSGALIMLFAIPVALGSWWGVLVNVPMLAGIVWRLLDEEKFLSINLAGYVEYLKEVRYRLAPYLW